MERFLRYIPWFRKTMGKVAAQFGSAIRELDALVEQNKADNNNDTNLVDKLEGRVDAARLRIVVRRKESERAERIAQRISELLN